MKTIGCAGLLVSDMFCGPMCELPREGQLLAVGDMPIRAGGCAANVAIDLVKQGLPVEITGCLGHDTAGDGVRTVLEGHGIGCARIGYTDEYPTSKTVILLVEGEDRRYIHNFGANAAFTVAMINRAWLADLGIFYLGGLCAMPGLDWTALRKLLAHCRAHGVITVVDVVVPQTFDAHAELASLLPEIDYFLPNTDEAALLTGETDPVMQLLALRVRGARSIVITLGKDGAIAYQGDEGWRCASYTMPVTDPSGSGDAFAAGVITGIAHSWEMPRLLRYAAALGASATQSIGTTAGVFEAAQAEAFIAARELQVKRC